MPKGLLKPDSDPLNIQSAHETKINALVASNEGGIVPTADDQAMLESITSASNQGGIVPTADDQAMLESITSASND